MGGANKISMPVVYSVQIVHLPCAEINTLCKQVEMTFRLTHVTQEFHRVRRKRFLSVLHVQRKACTYLGLRLTLSPKGSKHASTWPRSPKGSIGCAQNDFWAYYAFGANDAPVLRQNWHYLQMDRNNLLFVSSHLGVPLGVPKMISEPMVRSSQTVHLSCAEINNISKCTETGFQLTMPPRRSIGCG
jgi:hypothetical protein